MSAVLEFKQDAGGCWLRCRNDNYIVKVKCISVSQSSILVGLLLAFSRSFFSFFFCIVFQCVSVYFDEILLCF
jgi:hypothetical protein